MYNLHTLVRVFFANKVKEAIPAAGKAIFHAGTVPHSTKETSQ